MSKLGRNEKCLCGSGKKYKKCCLPQHQESKRQVVARTHHWSIQEVESLSTKEIFNMLYKFGVVLNEEEFFLQITSFNSAGAVSDFWEDSYSTTATGFDSDFLFCSCMVLWRRLAPHVLNIEQVDDIIEEGYRDLEEKKASSACNKWLQAWDYLQKQIQPNTNSVEKFEKEYSGYQNIGNWFQDFEMELWNAEVHGVHYQEVRIKYCEEFCSYFPNSSEIIIVNMQRAIADSYHRIGETKKGENTYKSLIKEYPNNVWGYVGWGDIYAHGVDRYLEKNIKKAKEIYQLALTKNIEDKDVIEERILDLMV